MSLVGIAAVIIFILYLIDKNRQWRAAGKVAHAAMINARDILSALVLLAILGTIGVSGFNKYSAWRAQREQADKRAALVKACIARNGTAEITKKACEEDPTSEWIPIGETPVPQFDPNQPYQDEQQPASNSKVCGLNREGHIVLDGNGGCIPPPPNGSIIVDAEPCWTAPDSKGEQFDQTSFKTLDGKPIPLKPNARCFPLAKKGLR